MTSKITPGKRASSSPAFWRLKRLRKLKGVTLEELAEKTTLTKSYLSKVERGVSVPSIATALKLAESFGVSVGELFGAEAGDKDFVVVRKSERKPFSRKGGNSRSRYEALAPSQTHGLFEAFVDHPPFDEPPGYKRAQHPGQEMIFVIRGRIDVAFPHSSMKLAAGDCIVFNGQVPHRVLSVRPKRAEALIVITLEKEQSQSV